MTYSGKTPGASKANARRKKGGGTMAQGQGDPMFSNLFGPAAAEEETLSQQVFNYLRNEILTARLAPGARLVRRAIAKRLGVSTIPVVEALLRLEMDGLVENVPHVGARVVEFTVEMLEGDRLLREAIECQVARTLAEQGARAPIPALMARAELLDEIEHAIGQGDAGMDDTYLFTHFDFHIALADATGWPSLTASMRNVWFRRIMVSITQNQQWFDVPPHWHASLVEAIAAGDPDAAEAKMREHVRHSRDPARDSLKETIRYNQSQWLRQVGRLMGNRVTDLNTAE